MTHHLDAAERHLEAVTAAEFHRQEVYADREIPDRADQLEKIGRAIRHGMAMARIHAELAVAEQLADLRADNANRASRTHNVLDALMGERFPVPTPAQAVPFTGHVPQQRAAGE